MSKIELTVIIPNYNGLKFMEVCMEALSKQTMPDFDVLIVDNGSTDGSVEWIRQHSYKAIELEDNLGFAGGVNVGIKAVTTPYVILLNNDTEVFSEFIEQLLKTIKKSDKIFSVSSCMIQANNHELMDDAGDGMCILGWAYQIGVGEPCENYQRLRTIFSACAGAAIYRREVFEIMGYFDEQHFAYLEDIDVGYRAKLHGYYSLYQPRAKVYHIGSGTSGSRYNSFKVKLAARNNIYLHYKNQSNIQLAVNCIPLILGIVIKAALFKHKGFLKDYMEGLSEGIRTCGKCKRVKSKSIKTVTYLAIEWEFIAGTFGYIYHLLKRRLIKWGI